VLTFAELLMDSSVEENSISSRRLSAGNCIYVLPTRVNSQHVGVSHLISIAFVYRRGVGRTVYDPYSTVQSAVRSTSAGRSTFGAIRGKGSPILDRNFRLIRGQNKI
jgi:hypothetical protein